MNLPFFENVYIKAVLIFIISGSLPALIHASNFSNYETILCKVKSSVNLETCINIKNANGTANMKERNGSIFVYEGTQCASRIGSHSYTLFQCVKGRWVMDQYITAKTVHRSKRFVEECYEFPCDRPKRRNRVPSITCPYVSTKYAGGGDSSVRVWWNEPRVAEIDMGSVDIQLIEGGQPGTWFDEGSHTIVYMAKDSSGEYATCSFTFNVIANTCQAPPSVDHGQFTCGSDGYNYLSTCYLSCSAGYVIERDNSIRCQTSKQWTSAGSCIVDVEPPRLDCGPNITAFAGPKLGKTSVTWTPVNATDNSRADVRVESDLPSGYLFEVGQTDVHFTARDASGNIGRCTKFITVTVKRCPNYQPIENANVSCSHANAYGSECVSVCNQGYQMVGADSQTCQENQTWSGSKPACNSRECGNPPFVAHGNYSCPSGLRYKNLCSLNCSAGYLPVTPTTIVCKSDQQWSQAGSCVDIEAPQFTKGCTRDFEVIAAAVRQRNYVRFTLPEAVDNSGEGVVITSNPISGSDFPLGASRVVVSATDSTGNQDNCSFSITVKSISCDAPNVNTSAKNVIVYDCPDQFVYGASCLMHCSNGDQIIGSNRMTCDKTRNSTQLDWKIDGNSFPFCNPHSCSKLNSPDNGALACNTSDGASEVCIVMCNDQYTYPYQTPFKFSCSKRTGTWLPNNTVQSCGKKRKPIAVTTELQFYYYTGSCSNDSATIKDKFLQTLGVSILRDACSEDSPCSVDTVELSCGAVVRRKRRDTSNVTFEFKISVVINIGEYKDLGDDEKTSKYYDDIVMGINAKIQTKADAGLLNIQSIGTLNKIEYGQVGLKCEPGTKMAQRLMACAGCGAGYMFINETESCQACPVGTYQEQDVAFSCTSCPDGQTTKDQGSTALTKCLDTEPNIVLISAAISAGACCVLITLFLTFFIYKRMRKRSIKT
ncbi:sushi, von Willebrand factor type A, EGF and pentraxin domain-containing protein 1-like [Physella acuta]|uniref:sushi, von Willebrand factor type A, EGF and pentraxin domain-containing protein 1-like n=1 Tax=Physella acuta TaxID=109671 RepID=UPI0027DC7EE6|nr:sushi, von Willebrand factor type A, EGF and pentraxin domain-containing protein 1-like [Physella acuta]